VAVRRALPMIVVVVDIVLRLPIGTIVTILPAARIGMGGAWLPPVWSFILDHPIAHYIANIQASQQLSPLVPPLPPAHP
jgi:hypothetical protein